MYKSRAENVVADSSSRKFNCLLQFLAYSMPYFGLVDDLKKEYTTNTGFKDIIAKPEQGQELMWPLEWKQGILYNGSKLFLVLTSTLVPVLLY